MAYSKLKNNGDEASTCLKSLNRKNIRQTFACPDSLIGFNEIHSISLTVYMGIPNSVRILYNTPLLNELETFFKPINS
jgi:hypothetical protein